MCSSDLEARDRTFDETKYENIDNLTKVKKYYDDNIIRYRPIQADASLDHILKQIKKFLKIKYNIHY